MKKAQTSLNFFSLLIALTWGLPSQLIAQDVQPAHFGLLYPLSTQGTFSPNNTNYFSLHALSGISGGERGLAVYGLAGIIKGDAEGLQVAGLVNLTEGNLSGLQVAGLLNRAGGSSEGIQIAGLTNLSRGNTPIQISGLYNNTDKSDAVQIAGLVNTTGESDGVQIAGLGNFTKRSSGVQVAGLVNTAEEVNGSQISGLINRAKVVRGVQIAGLINIADSSDYPIAIINLIKTGEKRIGLGTDENLSTMLSFRSGGSKLYGLIGLGTNLQYSELAYGFEAGLGLALHNSSSFRMDLEGFNLFMTDFHGSEYSKSGIRLLPALRLGAGLQLYGGPSLNFMHTDNSKRYPSGGLEIWGSNRWGDYRSLDLGYTVGIQLTL
ncbi:hypothetical protein [Lunatibacter salilacus]|uniref:hypothetical protein n=1 Tax=Lunatibacter salilacus TaxID=2483804 RepID=UPI00131CA001|nr:hypothetical protein [Lunatibacter salilacus]